MSTPDAESFDEWYRAIAASPWWDPFMREWLDLPARLQSSGYLTGPGLVEVSAELGLSARSTLVELGCGRGGYGMAIAQASGSRLVGVDFSPAALSEANLQCSRLGLQDQVSFQLGDLTDTGLPTEAADALLCVDAFHFAASTVAAARELRRLLKPGGRLVVTTWAPVVAADARLPARLRDLNVSRDLAAAGFVDIRKAVRPEWLAAQAALSQAATAVRVEGDPAVDELVEEANEFLSMRTLLDRVLVTASAPAPRAARSRVSARPA